MADTIKGTKNDDNLTVADDNIVVDAGAGNDNITFIGENSTVNGGAGNDNIAVLGDKNLIDGGAGNDDIHVVGYQNTIFGSKGNDFIHNNNYNYRGFSHENRGTVYVYGGGHDTIGYLNDDNVIVIEGYKWSVNTDGDYRIDVLNDKNSVVGSIAFIDYYGKGNLKIVSSKAAVDSINFIINDDSNKKINGTSGADIITNDKGKNLTITSGAGNDSIWNWYGDADNNNVSIDAGEGNDFISNNGNGVTVSGGAGNDYFRNVGSGAVYVYTDGNDTINGDGGGWLQSIVLGDVKVRASISATFGETILSLSNKKTLMLTNIDASKLNIVSSLDEVPKINFIDVKEYNTVITGKEQKGVIDFISVNELENGSRASNFTIKGSKGTYFITNIDDGIPFDLGTGKDTIENWGSNLSIGSGAGDDYIENMGTSNIINLGAGNDEIRNYGGTEVLINAGDGNDTILGSGSNSKIDGGSGNDWIGNDADNVSINGGAGDDTIENSGSNVTIDGGDGNDQIHCGNKSLINGGAGNDTIWSEVLATINGDDGNDHITDCAGDWIHSVKADGGNGNDELQFGGSRLTLNGGAGNDKIANTRALSDSTLSGGTGDDTINLKDVFNNVSKNILIKYANGDGNDIVYGFNKTDTLEISGAKYSTAKSGEDVIVTVGKGNITLSGAASLSTVNIRGTVGGGNDTSSGGGNDTTPAEDSTLLVVTDKTKSPVTVKSAIKTIDATARTKTIKITGNTKANSIVGGSNNDSIYGGKGNDTIRGNKGNDKLFGENGDDILYGGVGKDTLSGGADNDKLFGEDGNDSLSGGDGDDILSGGDDNDKLLGGNGDDSIIGGDGKDTLNGGKGNDTLTGGKGEDIFVYKSGDGDDIITDYAKEDKISITSGKASVTTRGNDVIFTVGSGKITLTGGKDKKITYIDDKGEHSYNSTVEPYIISSDGTEIALTKKFVKENFNVKSYGDEIQIIDASGVQHDINITGNNLPNKIIGTSQDDIIDGGGSADTIDGGKGNDSIVGGKGNDSLNGNKADDTLIGGAGSDTLTGGSGADVFVYKKGDSNDIITDYAEEDVISIQSGKATVSTKKNDVIFTVGSNKITVVGAKDKVITYVDSGGEHVYPKIFTVKGATITLTEKYMKNSFNVADYGDYDTINASEVQHGLNIVGNDSANSITGTTDEDTINGGAGNDTIRGGDGNDSLIGGKGKDYLYGGEGNDTLWGGAGNDYLYGGEGADIFIFDKSDGTDKIFGYEQGVDKIMILSNQKPVLVGTPSSNDVTFKVGSSKIVVDNAANTTIEFVKSNGKHLDSYTPSK